jgi:hypothetical protein
VVELAKQVNPIDIGYTYINGVLFYNTYMPSRNYKKGIYPDIIETSASVVYDMMPHGFVKNLSFHSDPTDVMHAILKPTFTKEEDVGEVLDNQGVCALSPEVAVVKSGNEGIIYYQDVRIGSYNLLASTPVPEIVGEKNMALFTASVGGESRW